MATDASAFAAIAAGEARTVIVVLERTAAARAAAAATADDGAALSAAGIATGPFATAKARLLRSQAEVSSAANGSASTVLALDYPALPVLLATVRGTAALAALRTNPLVAGVHPDRQYTTLDAESFALIRQPQAIAAIAPTLAGAGCTVAVLDTGLTYTLPVFGSCSAPGSGGNCRVIYAADIAPEDGALDDNGHGTNVAGIVADLAPGAQLISMDVFDGSSAWSSTVLPAIQWVIDNRARYNICAINLSLGGGMFSTTCPTEAMAVALQTARDSGVLAAVAAGNNGYTDALVSPACAPAAVSVGAVYDTSYGAAGCDPSSAADQVACFSNSAPFLTMLAPGVAITAAGTTFSGTSQAAPHVAGTIAILKSLVPSAGPDQLVRWLTSSGMHVTDARNGITKPRLDVYAAAVASGALDGVAPPDTVPPVMGTLTAKAKKRRRIAVRWTLASDAGSGVASYKLVYLRGTAPPAEGCTDGVEVLINPPALRVVVRRLKLRTWYTFRMCATDGAGNVAAGVTAAAQTTTGTTTSTSLRGSGSLIATAASADDGEGEGMPVG